MIPHPTTITTTLSTAVLAQGEPGQTLDILEIFLRSGPMAKIVFAILAALSIASWAVMISKALQYRRARVHGDAFLEVFRGSKRFSEVNAASDRLYGSPLVGLFQSGYAEIDAQVKAAKEAAAATAAAGSAPGTQPAATPPGAFRVKSLSGVERSLRRAVTVETGLLSRGTSILATTAAASPFIGLFGTVWGIMIAFGNIGLTGSASIAAVAPGIAEALVNTAAGLGAAIPALIGYNYFGFRLRALRHQMDDFVLEFLNLTERNFT